VPFVARFAQACQRVGVPIARPLANPSVQCPRCQNQVLRSIDSSRRLAHLLETGRGTGHGPRSRQRNRRRNRGGTGRSATGNRSAKGSARPALASFNETALPGSRHTPAGCRTAGRRTGAEQGSWPRKQMHRRVTPSPKCRCSFPGMESLPPGRRSPLHPANTSPRLLQLNPVSDRRKWLKPSAAATVESDSSDAWAKGDNPPACRALEAAAESWLLRVGAAPAT
jgi:hypothetical protein